jgi:hypothetical protein
VPAYAPAFIQECIGSLSRVVEPGFPGAKDRAESGDSIWVLMRYKQLIAAAVCNAINVIANES